MVDQVTLSVGGQVHRGWTQVSVRRAVDTLAGSFSLGASERWPGQQAARAIAPGDSCRVALGADTVIQGYIDDVEPAHDAEHHELRVRGRDATGDLVDCSAEHPGGEWANAKLDKIARDLCKPFGIKVSVATDIGRPFASFTLAPGESVFEALEHAARQRAVLLTSDGAGGLRLTREGAAGGATALIAGENILAGSGYYSLRGRYSSYRAVGQGPGGDAGWGETSSAPEGKASDPAVTRHRPLVIVAERPADAASLGVRAKWEARVRAARARTDRVTVQGWRDGAGQLWRPNTEVPVKDALLGIDARMLIVGVEHTLSDRGGSRTVLSLARAGAFELIESSAKEDEGVGW